MSKHTCMPSLKVLLMLGGAVLWLSDAAVSRGFGQTSFIITQSEMSDPPNLFPTLNTQTNYAPGSPPILFRTGTAPVSPGDYRFTHWTLNGQRVEDFTGRSINP